MKVISIGTDRKLFEENSQVKGRQIQYGKFFDEVHIVVFTTKSMNYKSSIKLSENVFVHPTNSKNKLFYTIDTFLIIRKLIGNWKLEIENSRNDVIISCQDPFESGLTGAFAKLFFDLPLHIQIHTDLAGKYFSKFFLNKIRLMFAEFVLKYSDRVRVVSERIKESIKDFSENVDVLPIKNELRDMKYEVREDRKSKNILTVCRLEKEKNLETAIKAFKIVSKKFPETVFTIAGDGAERKNLELLAESLGLESKIKFVGWQNNLEEYYKKADIYISTSLYEGYGVSVVEAGSFALPFVLSDTGLAGSIYKDGDSAFVCDALDEKCFANNILRLCQDKNLATKMGLLAREETKKHLSSYENYFEKYTDSIKQTAIGFKNKNIFKRIFEFKITFWSASIYARYFVCGITAAAINILALFIFTDTFGIWYLYSSILAFLLALFISFALQKFVVFRDKSTEKIHHQFSKFLIVAILGVITNTVIMFVCVDFLGIWYILSQVIAGFFVMIQNFLLYRLFIFNNTKTELPQKAYLRKS